jgi:hypothetical protein
MSELSARLQQLHDAGTPGPWDNYNPGDGTCRLYAITGPGEDDCERILNVVDGLGSGAYLRGTDGALIVALRNNAPEIIAALEAVERVRELHVPVDECPEWGHVATPHNCPNLLTICESDAEEWPCPTIRALDGE